MSITTVPSLWFFLDRKGKLCHTETISTVEVIMMIRYLGTPNLLLEALAYLGRRAGGRSTRDLLQRLENRGVTDLSDITGRLAPISAVTEGLDAALPDPEGVLPGLFGSFEGTPHNTIGSYSPAFLLLYPVADRWEEGLDAVADLVRAKTPERLAWEFACCLDIAEDTDGEALSYHGFSSRILSMQLPPESKVRILDLLHDPLGCLDRVLPWLERAMVLLQEHSSALEELAGVFGQELQAMGAAAFLSRTSGLSAQSSYLLRPFLLGFDTNLTQFISPQEETTLFCGFLRMDLQELLNRRETPTEDVYEAIRLLADRTRFDILCYLRDHRAYGQELSDRFGLSRNTIHHHMSKLLSVHLVRCTMDGNRVYYALDQDRVALLLAQQQSLLLREKDS